VVTLGDGEIGWVCRLDGVIRVQFQAEVLGGWEEISMWV